MKLILVSQRTFLTGAYFEMIQGICFCCRHPMLLRAVPKLNCLTCQPWIWMQFTSRWHGWNFYRLMNFLTQFANKVSATATVFVAVPIFRCRRGAPGDGEGWVARAGLVNPKVRWTQIQVGGRNEPCWGRCVLLPPVWQAGMVFSWCLFFILFAFFFSLFFFLFKLIILYASLFPISYH